jgi:hypothetical protein
MMTEKKSHNKIQLLLTYLGLQFPEQGHLHWFARMSPEVVTRSPSRVQGQRFGHGSFRGSSEMIETVLGEAMGLLFGLGAVGGLRV